MVGYIPRVFVECKMVVESFESIDVAYSEWLELGQSGTAAAMLFCCCIVYVGEPEYQHYYYEYPIYIIPERYLYLNAVIIIDPTTPLANSSLRVQHNWEIGICLHAPRCYTTDLVW